MYLVNTMPEHFIYQYTYHMPHGDSMSCGIASLYKKSICLQLIHLEMNVYFYIYSTFQILSHSIILPWFFGWVRKLKRKCNHHNQPLHSNVVFKPMCHKRLLWHHFLLKNCHIRPVMVTITVYHYHELIYYTQQST